MPTLMTVDGTFRTSRDVGLESGMRIKAEVRQPSWMGSSPDTGVSPYSFEITNFSDIDAAVAASMMTATADRPKM
jgi:hypothetical protein